MVTEFVSIELPGQLLVIKCDDSLGEGHRLVRPMYIGKNILPKDTV